MVYVVGTGAVTPLGEGVEALWSGLQPNATGFSHPEHLRTNDLPWCLAGEVATKTSLEEDRALVFAERAALEATQDAGWTQDELTDPETLLVVGTTKGGIGVLQRIIEGKISNTHFARSLLFMLAPRLAHRLGIQGAVATVSVACASGLFALGLARDRILRGEATRALVVGTDALTDFIWRGFFSLGALDPNGARPFDEGRAGLTVGEGACAVALSCEPGRYRASVLGMGAKNDANHITGPARDGSGLARTLRESLAQAGFTAEQVGFGLLHGTGTRFNDAMEGKAYSAVFGANQLPVASVKGAIGHLMGGAGLANVVAAVKTLESSFGPPSVGCQTIDPEISLSIAQTPTALKRPVVITSASGFSGINAACVLAPRSCRPSLMEPRRVRVTASVMLNEPRSQLVARVGGAKVARRLDDLCLGGLAAVQALLEKAGWSSDAMGLERHALILGTALGCVQSDHAYYRQLVDEGLEASNPRIFAYTLPNIVLGEIAIRHRWTGSNLVLSAGRASGLTALAEGAAQVAYGTVDVAVVLVLEAPGTPVTQTFLEGPPQTQTMAFLVESEARACARADRGSMRLTHFKSGWTPVADPEGFRCEAGDGFGAAGVAKLSNAVTQGAVHHAEATCATGYWASVRIEPD